ncbi:MAG: 3-ketoacyl-ACP reductase, partial [Thiotrichales bacterium SG8_50]
MLTGIDDKVALVTGGTGGIGSAICARLASAGARVATTYRNESKAQAWREEMRGKGYDIAVFRCDVADFD